MEIYLAVVGALALGLGLTSRGLRRLPMTEPLAALLIGVAIGPAAFGLVERAPADAALGIAAELSLALSVMAVALRHPFAEIRDQLRPLLVLLVVVLAGMAVIVGGLGALLLGLPLAMAALLGACLAPTDPVLAASIVAGEPAERDLPADLRLLISVESGANDGLAFGYVAIATTAAVTAAPAIGGLATEAGRALLEATVAVVFGGAVGWGAGRLVVWSDRHRELEHSAFLAFTLVLALFVLGAVELAGGQGVLGVLVAGLAYDKRISESERREEWQIQEAVNRYLVLPVFTLLGVALPWAEWRALGWAGVALAAAVLAVRRLPLVFALRGPLRLGTAEAVFAGWFGPIGVAALFYLTEVRATAVRDPVLWAAGTLVIAASVVAHGVSAAPGRGLYGRRRGTARGS